MKYAVITGAMGGLAKATIERLIKENYYVFALDLNDKVEAEYNNDKSMGIKCDITSDESVNQTVDKITTITDKIDVVINFAGVVLLGSVIEENVSKLEKILNVNVVGMYRVNKALFNHVLNGKGRYINISSEYGTLDAVPFHSFYTLSKHAVEIYNDSLRRELLRFNIPVVKIRPGSFKTNMQGGVMGQFETLVSTTKHYKVPLNKMKHIMTKELDKAIGPKRFVKVIMKAVTKRRPKYFYNVHRSFKMRLLSSLPDRLQDFIYSVYFK